MRPPARWVQLRSRSLGRRTVGALLLAFVVITLALLALNYWSVKHSLAQQSQAHQLGRLLARSIESLEQEDSARAVLQGFVAEYDQLRQEMAWENGAMSVELRTAEGRLLYRSGPPLDAWLQAEAWPSGPALRPWNGRMQSTFGAQDARWQLRIADPLPGDRILLGWLLGELGPSLALALPVLLLTLWLAVRTGLRPLREFTARIAGLDLRQDLAPLQLDLRYAELQPLAQAFDRLLSQLSAQRAQERAFVHDAAHELRTPLAALGAQTHVLLHSHDEAGRQRAAQALQQGVERTAHLSQQLLDLARLDPAASAAAHERFDLVELCAWVLQQAHPAARQRAVSLALEAPEHWPWQGSRHALQSLLQNLVDNGLRYGARELRLELQARAAGRLLLAVRDDGPGIAPEAQARMFERFWRGDQAQEHMQEPGSGLGLAIAAQAALQLGAELRVGPGLHGRGIGFELVLPDAPASSAAQAPAESA
ncbi:sensor histidine kinase [Paucibacter sp. B51]|uniref:sensor histidine kinase n=1 Tax=Paucibacter sp. B51 TaxID=2993315 RepID=UPI0022EBD39F|nr:ATP-binding protein [Paucibacter sp. B51]